MSGAAPLLRPRPDPGLDPNPNPAEVRARYLEGLEAEEERYRQKQRAYTSALKTAPRSAGYRGEMGPGRGDMREI